MYISLIDSFLSFLSQKTQASQNYILILHNRNDTEIYQVYMMTIEGNSNYFIKYVKHRNIVSNLGIYVCQNQSRIFQLILLLFLRLQFKPQFPFLCYFIISKRKVIFLKLLFLNAIFSSTLFGVKYNSHKNIHYKHIYCISFVVLQKRREHTNVENKNFKTKKKIFYVHIHLL